MCIICEGKSLVGIKILDCSRCPKLIKIPKIEGLATLKCDNCPNLTEIPKIEGLQELYCHNCPILYIPFKIAKKFSLKSRFFINKLIYVQNRMKDRLVIKKCMRNQKLLISDLTNIIANYC